MQRLKELASQPKPRKLKTTDPEPELAGQMSVQSTDCATEPAPKSQQRVDATSSTSLPSTTSKPAAKRGPTKRHGKTIESNKETEPTEPEMPIPPVKKGFQLPRALVRNPSMLSEIASRSSQDTLSRSVSYQSFDSMVDTPRRVSDISFSQHAASNTTRASTEEACIQAPNSQMPPSSQGDWKAESWLSPQPHTVAFHEDTLSPRPNPIPVSSSSKIHPPIEPTTFQQPPSRRSQVVIDLWSDDEDTAPATISPSGTHTGGPTSSSTTTSHSQVPSTTTVHTSKPSATAAHVAVPISALESRQAIAAARLKHFEKKAPETIDLTLDD